MTEHAKGLLLLHQTEHVLLWVLVGLVVYHVVKWLVSR